MQGTAIDINTEKNKYATPMIIRGSSRVLDGEFHGETMAFRSKSCIMCLNTSNLKHGSSIFLDAPSLESSGHILKIVSKKYETIKQGDDEIFGNDYETPDGTGIRDYIHVEDLSDAHLAALHLLDFGRNTHTGEYNTFNIGTGSGFSVLEIVETYEKINKLKIPYKIFPRRDGDIASSYADSTKANTILNWKASRTLKDMCQSAWNFQKIKHN